ncbi:reverse transcriptase domain-containing protein [Tanacetum coccineum]
MVFHNEDGNPARANIKQALGYLKDGDGDGNSQRLRYQKAKLKNFRDVNRDDEGSEGSDIDSTESNNEEDENPWGVNRPDRDLRKSHPDDFIDWLYTVERVFDIKNLTDEQKVKLVAIKLKKNAFIWSAHVIKQHNKEGKPKIMSWEKLKKKLMAKNLSVQYRQEAFIEYHNFKQSRATLVEEFTSKFDCLRLRCDVVEDEKEIIARYLAALKLEITDVVQLQQYWSYNDVCRLARKVESQQKKKVSSSSSSCFSGRFTRSYTVKKVANPSTNPTQIANSPTSYNPTSSREEYRRINDAISAKALDILPMIVQIDAEEITYADSSEVLVVRRSMSVVVKEDGLWRAMDVEEKGDGGSNYRDEDGFYVFQIDGSTSSSLTVMAGSSSSDPHPVVEKQDDIYPISDEKYAEQLQLEEALLFSSASLIPSSNENAALSSMSELPFVANESSQLQNRLCDICMDKKTESEMFQNT